MESKTIQIQLTWSLPNQFYLPQSGHHNFHADIKSVVQKLFQNSQVTRSGMSEPCWTLRVRARHSTELIVRDTRQSSIKAIQTCCKKHLSKNQFQGIKSAMSQHNLHPVFEVTEHWTGVTWWTDVPKDDEPVQREKTSEASATNSVSFQSPPTAADTPEVAEASLVLSGVASEAVNSLEPCFHNNAQQIQAIPESKTTKSNDHKAKCIQISFLLSSPNNQIFEKRAKLSDNIKTELKIKFSKKASCFQVSRLGLQQPK